MKDEILDILSTAVPSVDFEESDTMVDDGILTSIDLVQIVVELEMEYDIKLGVTDLTPDNFNSLDSIIALVEKKLG